VLKLVLRGSLQLPISILSRDSAKEKPRKTIPPVPPLLLVQIFLWRAVTCYLSHRVGFNHDVSLFLESMDYARAKPNREEAVADTGEKKASAKKVKVGVYYYPWYSGNFHGGKYLRQKLDPVQQPALGEYDDRDPDVIAQHVAWSQQANIDVWITSWWGPDSDSNRTTKDVILASPVFQKSGLQLALFYESTSRLGKAFDDISNIASDITYMAKTYFKNTNYLRIDGKPVLAVYLTRSIEARSDINRFTSIVRQAALHAGVGEIYLLGDHAFGKPPAKSSPSYSKKINNLRRLDAITNYDVYGSMHAKGKHATQAEVAAYTQAQENWRTMAQDAKVAFVPCVSPGFNDRGVRLRANHSALSRKLDSDESEPGSLFQAQLRQSVALVDDAADRLLMVTSFNEWHEDTQIEPVAEQAMTVRDGSDGSQDYTQGVGYEGYETLYLDLLRDETVEKQKCNAEK
jgi:glycoprotein endo-alpha-1,2-mannosidase